MVVIDEAVGANSENPIPDLLPDLPPLHTLVTVRTVLTTVYSLAMDCLSGHSHPCS